jgi:hypothetical protein
MLDLTGDEAPQSAFSGGGHRQAIEKIISRIEKNVYACGMRT